MYCTCCGEADPVRGGDPSIDFRYAACRLAVAAGTRPGTREKPYLAVRPLVPDDLFRGNKKIAFGVRVRIDGPVLRIDKGGEFGAVLPVRVAPDNVPGLVVGNENLPRIVLDGPDRIGETGGYKRDGGAEGRIDGGAEQNLVGILPDKEEVAAAVRKENPGASGRARARCRKNSDRRRGTVQFARGNL